MIKGYLLKQIGLNEVVKEYLYIIKSSTFLGLLYLVICSVWATPVYFVNATL